MFWRVIHIYFQIDCNNTAKKKRKEKKKKLAKKEYQGKKINIPYILTNLL